MQESVAPTTSLLMETNTIATISLVLFVTTCAYFCWRYWRFNRAYSKFPTLRMEIKGLFKFLSGDYQKDIPFTSALFQELIKLMKPFEKDGYFVFWFFKPYLVVFREDIVKRLYAEPALMNKPAVYNLGFAFFGNGLLNSNDDVWKSHRKILNPAFQMGSLKGKMRIFNKHAAALVAELENFVGKPTTHLREAVTRCTFAVMAESILGLNLKDEKYQKKTENYVKALEELAQASFALLPRIWLHSKYAFPFFAVGRKVLKIAKDIQSFTEEIVLEMKKSVTESEKGGVVKMDGVSFARILLDQHLKDPSFTMTDVQDQITTFMAAGHDTTMCAVLWCLYALGLHPDVQERAFKEDESLKEADVTFGELFELKYLECVIKETLRLYSVVPVYGRKLVKEIQWKDYTIPKGAEIVFIPYLLHKRPDIFVDPEKFDPSRFSDENNVRPWTFLPFAEGYRSCIGKKFALMEVKVILSHIIRRFKIKTLEEIDNFTDVDWVLVLKPAKPLRLLLTRR